MLLDPDAMVILLIAVRIAYGTGIEYLILPGVAIHGEVMRLDFPASRSSIRAVVPASKPHRQDVQLRRIRA